MPLNNSNNDSWFNHTIVKVAFSALLLAAAAWGNWVTTSIGVSASAMVKIAERLARIEQKLDDHFKEDYAQRHNP